MKRDAIIAISIILGLLAVGSISAFFLYVSPLTIGYITAIVSGMLVMFALGVHAASRSSEQPKTEESIDASEITTSAYPGAPRADHAYRSHALLRS
jgi:hypothetical protein